MIEQAANRSRFAVITFYSTSAFVATLGFSILLASLSVAYAIAQSLR
jgi:hypothetical protein